MRPCDSCDCDAPLEFSIAMAFQPIVDVENETIFAHEALVRGENGEGAWEILSRVNENNRYSFDQTCRTTAIRIASELGCQQRLSINFLPNAVYEPEACLQFTLKAAKKYNFPREKIIFEVTEHERVDSEKIVDIFRTYQNKGFLTAIDDFGEGFAGLNLLAQFQPDIIKLDMQLIRNIHNDKAKQAILKGILLTSELLEITVLGEGVETREEFDYLKDQGLRYMQGYFLARPQFMQLATIEDVLKNIYDH
ncbi:EAL domain-containing protein [Lacimicrobium alkaliphilum]|uniref:Diguanylate phosphodiesterase n=1 Tax=Lacimicrobium alkaliphilum TaxID=1526571 RepID=A0A0U3AXV9_9ALTE|nr:EAL domain-containing protein [Lacimicrobium alkaliphilum]ALS98959.1 diguanylate phosphodiesterase [Lacimicrobium alkaliphilum]